MTYTRHPALTFLLVVAAALLGVLVMHVGIAAADTGLIVGDPPPWTVTLQRYTPAIVLGVYGVLYLLIHLGAQRWRWTAWLRVGRRQAHLAAGLASIGALLPDALDGTLRSGALVMCLSSWGLARAMPGGLEQKGETSGEIVTTEAP